MEDERRSGAAGPSGDWAARTADTIEQVVDAVHDRVIRPLVIVARALVFGILVSTMVLVLGVLTAIAVVRVLDTYAFGHRVWASEALVGGIFTLFGLLAWALRRSRRAEEG
ncbi:MAG: hypothetical protein ACYDA2_06640 [Acidimicrobiales bacterium]